MLDVTAVLRPEREALLALLSSLDAEAWGRPTECPAYDVQGIATHLLGDDLSLLSRQRDSAPPGVLLVAEELPGADFRTLLDAFNDRWVAAARFLSPAVLVELLRVSGEWTADFYGSVDLDAPGEPVGLFGAPLDGTSPYWQAVAREYVERWAHHSQILRALGRPSLHDERFLRPGAEVAAAALRWQVRVDGDGGSVAFDVDDAGTTVELGPAEQAAALLTRAHPADDVRHLVVADGPGADGALALLALALGRP